MLKDFFKYGFIIIVAYILIYKLLEFSINIKW